VCIGHQIAVCGCPVDALAGSHCACARSTLVRLLCHDQDVAQQVIQSRRQACLSRCSRLGAMECDEAKGLDWEWQPTDRDEDQSASGEKRTGPNSTDRGISRAPKSSH